MARTSSPRLTSEVGANVTGTRSVAIDAQQGEVVAGVGATTSASVGSVSPAQADVDWSLRRRHGRW